MLDTIKEIIHSLKKTSSDRISNPFYGVFIFTWTAFNWEAISIFLFSEIKMENRVSFINSAYPLMFFYPFIVSVALTFLLPYCTEKITFFQSKPLSRTSSLLAIRKKKILTADISVERYRAKKDVAYDRYKVGAEKEIQDMRELITISTERTGQLTASLEDANKKVERLESEIRKLKPLADELKVANESKLALQIVNNEKDDHIKKLRLVTDENSERIIDLTKAYEFAKTQNRKLVENHKNIFSINEKTDEIFIRPSVIEKIKKLNEGNFLAEMRDLNYIKNNKIEND